MTIAQYEAVIVTLILVVECLDLFLAQKARQKQAMARRAARLLKSLGIRG